MLQVNEQFRRTKQTLDYTQLKYVSGKYNDSPIWIGGDFNLPDIDWSNNTITSHQFKERYILLE